MSNHVQVAQLGALSGRPDNMSALGRHVFQVLCASQRLQIGRRVYTSQEGATSNAPALSWRCRWGRRDYRLTELSRSGYTGWFRVLETRPRTQSQQSQSTPSACIIHIRPTVTHTSMQTLVQKPSHTKFASYCFKYSLICELFATARSVVHSTVKDPPTTTL